MSGRGALAASQRLAPQYRGARASDRRLRHARVRQEVVLLCDQWRRQPAPPDARRRRQEEHLKTKYWVAATKAERSSVVTHRADNTYNGA
jgi:hypothetical protein